MEDIPSGLCGCGCGQPTRVSRQTDTKRGYVRGQPMRYLPGHALAGEARRKEAEFISG